jgi:hypothetical protein
MFEALVVLPVVNALVLINMHLPKILAKIG